EEESERVHTPPEFIPTNDDDKIDDEETMDEEDDDESGFEQVEEDVHVTLTAVHDKQKTDGTLESSSVSSNFISKLLNLDNTPPLLDETSSQTSSLFIIPVIAIPEITSTITVPPPPPFFNPLQVTNLEKDLSEMKQVDQYAQAISLIPAIVDRYNDNKLEEAINKAILAYNLDCKQEAQDDKNEYIGLVDTSMRTIVKEEVTTQLPQLLPQATAASLSKFELTKMLIEKKENNKSYDKADHKRELYEALVKGLEMTKTKIKTPSLDQTEGRKEGSQARKLSHPEIQDQRKISLQVPLKIPPTLNTSHPASLPMQRSQVILLKTHKCNMIKSLSRETMMNNPMTRRLPRLTVTRAEEPRTSFDELMDTSFDFYAFVLNRLNITDLTQEILFGPEFNLLKDTCKSITELKYNLKECSKATTERLDWHNPEGKPYATNLSSSKDVYSRKRIITVTRLAIVKKYDYDHLEEIKVHQEDQQLHTFKEGDFSRLRLQDMEDMLLLLVQKKLTNLTIDEQHDLNVALRMFTRHIVIQKQEEDLQLVVKSYQKKLNLTKPDSYRSDLKNKTAYTSSSDPHGMIYVD
ncbi:hypothetical protein Tco_1037207, partial [Tanacetum coccineum]